MSTQNITEVFVHMDNVWNIFYRITRYQRSSGSPSLPVNTGQCMTPPRPPSCHSGTVTPPDRHSAGACVMCEHKALCVVLLKHVGGGGLHLLHVRKRVSIAQSSSGGIFPGLRMFTSQRRVVFVLHHFLCALDALLLPQTRMQSLHPEPAARYRNVMDALRQIVRTEGVWRPIRGVNVLAVGAGPAHALYFASYEKIKFSLSDSVHPGANSHFANGVAGCVATVLHDTIMNPAEVVKQRMQMFNSPYRGVLDCVGSLLRRDGPAAFYRSYTTQLTMNVPFQALHFMTYEYLQELLNPHRQYNPSSHVASGALAGALAAAATTPLDVCKTLLNTQEAQAVHLLRPAAAATTSAPGARHISGLGEACRTVYRTGGAPAFFKGVHARIIYQMPSTAISWSVYEFFKYVITERRHERSRRRGGGDRDGAK
uniref:Solute carrier family 25 member 28 n=1 Tax=Gasterosteus aculeatus aculeatus TaxID=481459 RepID=A0AAQ4RHU8_GASAC